MVSYQETRRRHQSRLDAQRSYDPSDAHYEDHSEILHRISYVYRCRDVDSKIIYVGYSAMAHLTMRFYEHQRAAWWARVAAIDWAEFDDPFKAEEEEIQQIHQWHPEGNRQRRGCGREAKPTVP